jgi:hypothetical protein
MRNVGLKVREEQSCNKGDNISDRPNRMSCVMGVKHIMLVYYEFSLNLWRKIICNAESK